MVSDKTSPEVEVFATRIATGGEAVARLDDGRVVFVRGALPDERVAVRVEQEKKRYARGTALAVIEASPDRVEASCSHARDRTCGGCDWLHVAPAAQRRFKEAIVVEQLERLGGVPTPIVSSIDHPRGRRTTVRCRVTDGRAGYRSARSTASFPAVACGAAHPLIEELIVEGRFGDAFEVTLRAGAATGERLAVVDGPVDGVALPDDVRVVPKRKVGRAAYHEDVLGRRWRISARSFFQTSLPGAEALVAGVESAVSGSDGPLVDLYGGVGLLGAVAEDRLVACVEQSRSAAADARHNLAAHVEVAGVPVERWVAQPATTIIADPARPGLERKGVEVIEATGAGHLALVSCDPAALGRDAALLREQGWRHEWSRLVDMFPDTSRVEVVSRFVR